MADKKPVRINRRDVILQTLAGMLQSQQGVQRITTAKLAATVGISEAALYRHFPNKTAMFNSLIEFIESSLCSRINFIIQDEKETITRVKLVISLILRFAEKNPGLSRIMTGHALMFEHPSLNNRVNQLFARIETQLRQILRENKLHDGDQLQYSETFLASQLITYCEGCLSRFVRSNFHYLPTDEFDTRWRLLMDQLTYPTKQPV